MIRRDYTTRTAEAEIRGGRTLRAALVFDPDGEPADLLLSVAWSDSWRSVDELRLPAEAAPLLRDALAALLEREQ